MHLKRHILSLALLLSFPGLTQYTLYEWGFAQGTDSAVEQINDLQTDNSGNLYVVGNFTGTQDFDPSAGTLDLTSSGQNDLFIQKLTPDGNLLWAHAIGGIGEDYATSVTVDEAGFVYIAGYFRDSVDFDPGPGNFDLINPAFEDAFVLKLDDDGNFVDVWQFGGPFAQQALLIKYHPSGHLFTVGRFGLTVDFDPGPGTYDLSSTGGLDIFVHKMDTDGNFVWASRFGGVWGIDWVTDMDVNASGEVIVSGHFDDTIDFDPGPAELKVGPKGDKDFFLCKLDGNGDLDWAFGLGGDFEDIAAAVRYDSWGNVYALGDMWDTGPGTIDLDPGPGTFFAPSPLGSDLYILKYNGSGELINLYEMASLASNISFEKIEIDQYDNVYLSGDYSGAVDFDLGSEIFNGPDDGSAFVCSMDSLLDLNWFHAVTAITDSRYYTADIDGSGNVYAAGRFTLSCDVDSGSGSDSLFSSGTSDAFIVKYGNTPVSFKTDYQNGHDISVWPNPSDHHIILTGLNVGELVRIMDMNGRVLIEQLLPTNQEINVEFLHSGIYTVNIYSDGINHSQKFIKL